MNAVLNDPALVVLLLVGLVGFAFVGYRWPTALLLLALGSYAVSIESLITDSGREREVAQIAGFDFSPLHKGLLLAALIVYTAHYGLRLRTNWPILAVLAILGLNLFFADLYRNLTTTQMLRSAVSFMLPWCAINIVFAEDARKYLSLLIPIIPLVSVIIGLVLFLINVGQNPIHGRLGGASISSSMSYMSFAGFAVALHESFRRRQTHFIYLAFINLALVIMAGGRMGILASMVIFASYSFFSEDLRRTLGRRAIAFILSGMGVAFVLLLYLPFLQQRMAGVESVQIPMTNRDVIWAFLWEEFLVSPIFGRGIGAGAVATLDANLPARGAHNEYLRILVEGGVAGFLLYFGAVGLWFQQLLHAVRNSDRAFVWPLLVALAVYAVTDNILTAGAALPLYIYMGVLVYRRRSVSEGRKRRSRRVPLSRRGGITQHGEAQNARTHKEAYSMETKHQ